MIQSEPVATQLDDVEFQRELRRIVDRHMSAKQFLDILDKLVILETKNPHNIATLDNPSRLELACDMIFTVARHSKPEDRDEMIKAIRIIRTVIDDSQDELMQLLDLQRNSQDE